MFSVKKWTSWAQWYTAIADQKETSHWKLKNSASRESCSRRSNHRDERNNMLKWQTYNLLVNWKETILESSKSRFKRCRSDFSVKTCSNYQLNIPVLNRSQRRFRALNDVFSAKVNELSAMIYCNHGPKRDFSLEIEELSKSGIMFPTFKPSRRAK